MQEYPKALYKGEEFVVVDDEAGEKEARGDGYAMIGEEEKKRGRPPKVAE